MTLLDNLILLSAAGLLTGLLVPFVAARMNEQRVVRQRQAEENIARDSKFIEAQTDFLDRLSTDLWRLAGRSSPSLTTRASRNSRSRKRGACTRTRPFRSLFGLRAHVSRAQHLLSAEAQQQLADLHAWLFGDVDPPFTTAARKSLRSEGERTGGDWSTWHGTTMTALFARIDTVLITVAKDIGAIQRGR